MTPFRLVSRVRPGAPRALSAVPRGGADALAASAPASDPVPVPVPWRVVARSPQGVVEVEHRGQGPLRAVRFALAGGGLLGLSRPRTVHPGERLPVVLLDASADGALTAPDAMLILRWFQPDGTELLWPIAL